VIRAVIDTTVLVSGLISPKGNEALTILAINHGFVCPCLSDAVMQEYTSVLARPKFAFLPHEIADMVAMLVRAGNLFHLFQARRSLPIQPTRNFCIWLSPLGLTSS
jgi:putative PIN family toxin of toxin-antitoxin system